MDTLGKHYRRTSLEFQYLEMLANPYTDRPWLALVLLIGGLVGLYLVHLKDKRSAIILRKSLESRLLSRPPPYLQRLLPPATQIPRPQTLGGLRTTMAHGFSASAMTEQQPLIKGYVELLIQRLRGKANNGKAIIDMHAWYNYCTFDIIGDLAFAEAFGCLRESAMYPWISLVFANIKLTAFILVCNRIPVFYVSLPLFVSKKLLKQFMEHQQISREKAAKRLALKDARPDFVQNMTSGKGGLVCYFGFHPPINSSL